MPRTLRAALITAAFLAILGARTGAQKREPYVAYPERQADEPEPYQEAPGYLDEPPNAFELALGDDGIWLGYRSGFHRGEGYAGAEFFADQDNDYALAGRWMRFGEPSRQSPLGLGIGLGAFGAVLDESDSEALAITIDGAVDFALDEVLVLDYPTRIGLEVNYSPDVATFLDGRRVVDLLGRVEIDLSVWATFFAGYRHLELDLDDEDDAELDSSFQAGVRLGF